MMCSQPMMTQHRHPPGVAAGRARPRPSVRRRAMTLLEVMLALSLTAVVLAAISMAIDLHLRLLDSRRGSVERIQLARAVLQIIANDLRATVQRSGTEMILQH